MERTYSVKVVGRFVSERCTTNPWRKSSTLNPPWKVTDTERQILSRQTKTRLSLSQIRAWRSDEKKCAPKMLQWFCALPAEEKDGGAEEIRTPDPHNAIVVLYQLSYDPIRSEQCRGSFPNVKTILPLFASIPENKKSPPFPAGFDESFSDYLAMPNFLLNSEIPTRLEPNKATVVPPSGTRVSVVDEVESFTVATTSNSALSNWKCFAVATIV